MSPERTPKPALARVQRTHRELINHEFLDLGAKPVLGFFLEAAGQFVKTLPSSWFGVFLSLCSPSELACLKSSLSQNSFSPLLLTFATSSLALSVPTPTACMKRRSSFVSAFARTLVTKESPLANKPRSERGTEKYWIEREEINEKREMNRRHYRQSTNEKKR